MQFYMLIFGLFSHQGDHECRSFFLIQGALVCFNAKLFYSFLISQTHNIGDKGIVPGFIPVPFAWIGIAFLTILDIPMLSAVPDNRTCRMQF